MREERIYQPHVTLARRARPVEAEVPALQWHVTEARTRRVAARRTQRALRGARDVASVTLLDKRPVSRFNTPATIFFANRSGLRRGWRAQVWNNPR